MSVVSGVAKRIMPLFDRVLIQVPTYNMMQKIKHGAIFRELQQRPRPRVALSFLRRHRPRDWKLWL